MVKNNNRTADEIVGRFGLERAVKLNLVTLGGKGFTVQAVPTSKGRRFLREGTIFVRR